VLFSHASVIVDLISKFVIFHQIKVAKFTSNPYCLLVAEAGSCFNLIALDPCFTIKAKLRFQGGTLIK
jgi:hypothetical protein